MREWSKRVTCAGKGTLPNPFHDSLITIDEKLKALGFMCKDCTAIFSVHLKLFGCDVSSALAESVDEGLLIVDLKYVEDSHLFDSNSFDVSPASFETSTCAADTASAQPSQHSRNVSVN